MSGLGRGFPLGEVRAKLQAITDSHKFNVASLPPSEVHSLAFEAQELLDAGEVSSPGAGAAVAAIAFAIETPEGLAFLRAWQQGDFDSCRREWPQAPQSIYYEAEVV